MGNRANCVVHQNSFNADNPPVWLYTHWGGSELLQDVQTAIRKRWRWDDDTYLTRIIFDTMSAGQQGQETGYGISTAMGDNSHDLVVVDPSKQEVRIEDPETCEVKNVWSFEAFCDADLSSYQG